MNSRQVRHSNNMKKQEATSEFGSWRQSYDPSVFLMAISSKSSLAGRVCCSDCALAAIVVYLDMLFREALRG